MVKQNPALVNGALHYSLHGPQTSAMLSMEPLDQYRNKAVSPYSYARLY